MKKGFLAIALGFSLCVSSLLPTVADAATYQVSSERGLKHLAWSRNTVTWTTNRALDITSSDAWQNESGIFVRNAGVTKLSKSNYDNVWYNFKNTFTAGAVIGGQTIGYTTTITDQVKTKWNGEYEWSYDI